MFGFGAWLWLFPCLAERCEVNKKEKVGRRRSNDFGYTYVRQETFTKGAFVWFFPFSLSCLLDQARKAVKTDLKNLYDGLLFPVFTVPFWCMRLQLC
ncbi:hypothetical protein B0H63DRAFT_18446 [Podospora didyma]|uniref:Secreted protein n=1 Tax=Podospora didyma TaxID=330526 RepID=A0AAE0U763_9PEZI|nr:hypothetical protein B0H63DRAFT_18446 [Podospora didyma]